MILLSPALADRLLTASTTGQLSLEGLKLLGEIQDVLK